MHGNRHFLIAILTPGLMSPFVLQAPAEAQARISGRVLGENGQPISQVFVQQQGTLATAFTDEQGRFTLTLDAHGRPMIELSAVGYQPTITPLETASTRPIQLEPVFSYQPTYQPVVPARASTTPPLMDTQVGLAYRLRNLGLSHQGQRVEGNVDNELYGQGQLRAGQALFGISVARFQVPVTLPDAPAGRNPVADPEVIDIQARGGWVLGGPGWEAAPSLSVVQESVTPNNNGIPYTGTLLDFSQVRRGIGLAVPGILALGRVELLGEAAWYPWTWVTLERAPYGVGASNRIDMKAGVGYRFLPSVRGELSYARHMWRGAFEQNSDLLSFGVTYRPERTEERP